MLLCSLERFISKSLQDICFMGREFEPNGN